MKTAQSAATPSETERDGFVQVRGAREHNLKNVDVDIPRNQLVVFTGISGSGKSSLAFGTIYAEAQRRYFESVAPYARRLIDQVGVPDVDAITGLPPAVALQQQRGSPNVRSSVGSVTTLSNLLRMLYSRAGSYPARQPMLYAEDFSPNTAEGACPHCHGLGQVYEVSEKLMVPDPSLTIREKAIAAWPGAWQGQNQRDILVTLGYDVDVPWRELPKRDRNWILYTDEQPTVPVYAGFTPKETRAALRRKLDPSYQGTFMGVRKYVLHTFATTGSAMMKRKVAQFMTGAACPVCHGKRLKKESLSVKFAGYDIAELSGMSMDRLAEIIAPIAAMDIAEQDTSAATLSRDTIKAERSRRAERGEALHQGAANVRITPNLSVEKQLAAKRILGDVLSRIKVLQNLGLGYLGLDRSTPTLSPGELQRLRLATQLRSNLFGVIYVLDEPSAGLHPGDGEALLDALQGLKHSGNSIFVVEHDLATMRRADWLVEVGPGAGHEGGHVLYSGPPPGLQREMTSRTRPYLFETGSPRQGPVRTSAHWLTLKGIVRNNLENLDVSFPIAALTCVTGVSGSGKSSLVSQALVDLVSEQLGSGGEHSDAADDLPAESVPAVTQGSITAGIELLRRLVVIDQKPIGRTPRSNLATYTGLFDRVRQRFADTPGARRRRFSASRFSFNLPQGRCQVCEGEGFVSVELLFMPSVFAPCPTCHGKRYNDKTLEVELNGKNIAAVLQMTVKEAFAFFADDKSVCTPLAVLSDLGLGYLRLGQPATELSGGEAQRIKLATELQRSHRGDTLYVLDEPTIGLHPEDVDRLLLKLNELVDEGNTVILVEHEMRVVAAADWVIDIGPGAGERGGKVVGAGTPQTVAGNQASRTAQYLHQALHPSSV
jgi:excinuclease ABC subunit A